MLSYKRKQHTLLHQIEATVSSSDSTTSANCALNASRDAKCPQTFSKLLKVTLPTATLFVRGMNGQYCRFQVLLESSSQESYMIKSIPEVLGKEKAMCA